MSKEFDEELFLKGGMVDNYFELNKRGDIIPSSLDSSTLSKDIRKAFHIITMRDNLDIYIYNEKLGYYEGNGKQILREIVKKVIEDYYSEKNANATINHITTSTVRNRDELDPPTNILSVKNGLLNIDREKTTLLEHSPTWFFTENIPVSYDPNAKCPEFLRFLEQIQPDYNNRAKIQEIFGYCLWREYPHQVSFLLIGGGSNGRSTLLAVLRALLGGRKNVSSETLQSLCHDKFSKAELYLKYANICGDLPSKAIKDTSAFKMLCGGDSISAQKKHRDPFNFVNYAKLIFLPNRVPYSYDDSDAYYRRWVMIFFPVRFGIQMGDLPVDKHILEKLTTPEELSGILNWALEGLKRLREQKEFTNRMTIEQTKQYYERLVSPLSAFIQDKIIVTFDPENFITKEEFYSSFLDYCKEKKIIAPTYENVGRLMKKVSKGIGAGHKTIFGKQRYVWTGCQYNLTEEELQAREREIIDVVYREAQT